MNEAILALHEHLGDTGCHTKVTVNLERRMCIEEVGESASIWIFALHALVGKDTQHVADNLERMVAVLHARPEVGLPAEAPSRSLVTALFERLASCCKELGSARGADLIRRIKSVEMRDVTMLVVRIVYVLQPFLQLSILAHLHRRQLGDGLLECFLIGFVTTEDTGSLQHIVHHIEDNLVVHRAACAEIRFAAYATMLGTYRRNHHQITRVGMLYQEVEEEVGGTLHDGIILGKEQGIACELIVLPKVRGKPSATTGIHAPRSSIHGSGNTPEVGVVVSHPTTATIHHLRRLGARFAQVTNHREERLCSLAEVADLGGPIVHLGVDVDGVFAVPRSILLVVPDALQVGRLSVLAPR